MINYIIITAARLPAVRVGATPCVMRRNKVKLWTTNSFFGTKGGPRLIKGGSWPTSQALVVNKKVYVIDAGLGVTRQFIEAGFTYEQLETIFVTHHHSDHNIELGGLVYTSWVGAPAHKINIFGPTGLSNLMWHFIESQSFDINIRIHDEGLDDIRRCFTCTEYTQGVVFEDDNVKVEALRVQHPPVDDCFALKFETSSSKIVFGADTAYHTLWLTSQKMLTFWCMKPCIWVAPKNL